MVGGEIALGVVGLAITLCDKILDYRRRWKSFDRSLDFVENEISHVRAILINTDQDFPVMWRKERSLANLTESRVEQLTVILQKLEEAIRKQRSPGESEGFYSNVKAQAKRAAYPFHAAGISRMVEEVKTIRMGLIEIDMKYIRHQNDNHGSRLENIQNMLCSLNGNQIFPASSLRDSWEHLSRPRPMTPASPPSVQDDIPYSDENILVGSDSSGDHALDQQETNLYRCRQRLLHRITDFFFRQKSGAGGASLASPLLPRYYPRNDRRVRLFTTILKAHIFDAGKVDEALAKLRCLVSERILVPRDTVDGTPVLQKICFPGPDAVPGLVRIQPLSALLRYMLHENPEPVHPTTASEGLYNLCQVVRLRDEDLPWIKKLGARVSIPHPPRSPFLRKNSKLLLSKLGKVISIPDIAKIIIRESEEQLRAALGKNPALANQPLGECSPLQLAFGWPEGVKILLEYNACPVKEFHVGRSVSAADIKCARLLLSRGCLFDIHDINQSTFSPYRTNLQRLIIDQLASRRRDLWTFAKENLSPDQLPAAGDTSILDSEASVVVRKLSASGNTPPPALLVAIQDRESIYSSVYERAIMDRLFKAGFQNVEPVNRKGATPLMTRPLGPDLKEGLECLDWLVGHKADPSRKLPGSQIKTAHLLTMKMLEEIIDPIQMHVKGRLSRPALQTVYEYWERSIRGSGTRIFLIPSGHDSCICTCSGSNRGCTTLSIAIRHVLSAFPLTYDCQPWFRKVLEFVSSWHNHDPDADNTVIEQLTFNALGMGHTCCVEGDGLSRLNSTQTPMSDKCRQTIRLGQKHRLKEYKKVVKQLLSDFKASELTLFDFMDGQWAETITKLFSEKSPCCAPIAPEQPDEVDEHIQDTLRRQQRLICTAALGPCDCDKGDSDQER